MLGAIPFSDLSAKEMLAASEISAREEFDMSWTSKLAGKKVRAVFDCADHENGAGVLRASMWEGHYSSTMNVPRSDIMTVLILRHAATILALRQDMWDKYGIGAARNVKNFLTEQPTDRNPALLTASDGIPANFVPLLLQPFLDRGGIVLVCGVALRNWSAAVATKDGVSRDEAYTRAVAGLVKGTILQPSGVFAAVRAGQEGCAYVRAA